MKWFGKVTLGKLGNIYLGETPCSMKVLRVGVRPRCKKSARKPSRDISIVVGAKAEVPFESRSKVDFVLDLRDA